MKALIIENFVVVVALGIRDSAASADATGGTPLDPPAVFNAPPYSVINYFAPFPYKSIQDGLDESRLTQETFKESIKTALDENAAKAAMRRIDSTLDATSKSIADTAESFDNIVQTIGWLGRDWLKIARLQ
ncbi:hypothetical protein GNI_133290 [Gregarina niphandrodes]|uniref:Transmembrane protein n=1 Tax=Gregarina niphandrodes TaxID=110365 RepID=A0A023B161_GRENI|nr:hypothetical protein GNI_133290 [Gregarina niphandrodes]EZG46761.1 hypothetical protein GNI_133290 [Gregarina niphandrodes]|eukprot:XP_011132270.1 hypothetical protein GNI_133290 [Gregarina niphandrodes]